MDKYLHCELIFNIKLLIPALNATAFLLKHIDVRAPVSNYIPYKTIDVLTCLCPNPEPGLGKLFEKETPCVKVQHCIVWHMVD